MQENESGKSMGMFVPLWSEDFSRIEGIFRPLDKLLVLPRFCQRRNDQDTIRILNNLLSRTILHILSASRTCPGIGQLATCILGYFAWTFRQIVALSEGVAKWLLERAFLALPGVSIG